MSVLYTWLFVNAKGSALLAVLFHAAGNVCTVSAATAASASEALVILALEWLLAGAVAVWWTRSPVARASSLGWSRGRTGDRI